MNQLGDLLDDKAKELFDGPVPLGKKSDIPPTSSNKENLDGETPHIDTAKIKTMIYSMRDQLDAVLRVLNGHTIASAPAKNTGAILETGERIVEGVFTGDSMLGQDGKEYRVPPNYASKSKLVEGDIMKLTITNGGKFIYKQIKPAEHTRAAGELVAGEHGGWSVLVNGKPYNVLSASITFYKGKPGDEVVVLIPKDGGGSWGAVEHIMQT